MSPENFLLVALVLLCAAVCGLVAVVRDTRDTKDASKTTSRSEPHSWAPTTLIACVVMLASLSVVAALILSRLTADNDAESEAYSASTATPASSSPGVAATRTPRSSHATQPPVAAHSSTLPTAPRALVCDPAMLTTRILCLDMPSESYLTRPLTTVRLDGALEEDWLSGSDFDSTVAALQLQLPVGEPLEGIPWCKQDYYAPTRMLSWVWGKPGTARVVVEIDPALEDERRAVVFLTFYEESSLLC